METMKFSLLRRDPPAEFKIAVRCFESGLFEQAALKFIELLRQDPSDADCRYFLRLTERRMMPLTPSGPVTLIWQCDPDHTWERDWVRTLLSGSFSGEVVDKTWTAMAPRMIVIDNGLVEAKASYYRDAFDRGCRIVLVHLSDEAFVDITGPYRFCEAVLRNYRSEVLATHTGVHFFPLGYKMGFSRGCADGKSTSNRRYLWSFAGDAKKTMRQSMLAAMQTLPQGFLHLTEGFGSADCLSTEAYRALLDDTVIVPCPGGWSNLETFRVYEALEAGCIPIVERRPAFDYFTDLLGAHPLPTVSDWAEAVDLIRRKNVDEVESLRFSCDRWWRAFKRRLHSTLTSAVARALT